MNYRLICLQNIIYILIIGIYERKDKKYIGLYLLILE